MKVEDERLVTTFLPDGDVMWNKSTKLAMFCIDFEGEKGIVVSKSTCETEEASVNWGLTQDADKLRTTLKQETGINQDD